MEDSDRVNQWGVIYIYYLIYVIGGYVYVGDPPSNKLGSLHRTYAISTSMFGGVRATFIILMMADVRHCVKHGHTNLHII